MMNTTEAPVWEEEYQAGEGQEVCLRQLTYAPLDYATHPIDTAPFQEHGWGPFEGAYTPWDFASAKDIMGGVLGIDITYDFGDNRTLPAVPFNVMTIMQDKSLSFVDNEGFVATLLRQSGQRSSNATISNAPTVQTTGVTPTPSGVVGFWQSLGSLLRGNGS